MAELAVQVVLKLQAWSVEVWTTGIVPCTIRSYNFELFLHALSDEKDIWMTRTSEAPGSGASGDGVRARESSDIDALVGVRLKLRRNVLGMTQLELAERCNLSAQQVHKYEQGMNSMNAVRLARAAEVLAVPVSWFFGEIEVDAELPNDLVNILSDPQNTKILSLFREIDDFDLKNIIINIAKELSNYRSLGDPGVVKHESISARHEGGV